MQTVYNSMEISLDSKLPEKEAWQLRVSVKRNMQQKAVPQVVMATFFSFPAQTPSFIRIILIMNSLYCLFSIVLLNLHCNSCTHIHTQVTTKFLLRSPSAEEHHSCLFLLNTPKVTFWTSCPNFRVSICIPTFLKECETGYNETKNQTSHYYWCV